MEIFEVYSVNQNLRMEIEAAKLSDKEQFLIRKQIVNLRLKGISKSKTAKALGVIERHVASTWARYKKVGMKGIAIKTRDMKTGKKRKLTPEQEKNHILSQIDTS
jgi:transposase